MCNYLPQVTEKVIGVESKFDCCRGFLALEPGVLVRLTVGAGMTALTRLPSAAFPSVLKLMQISKPEAGRGSLDGDAGGEGPLYSNKVWASFTCTR